MATLRRRLRIQPQPVYPQHRRMNELLSAFKELMDTFRASIAEFRQTAAQSRALRTGKDRT